MANSDNTLEILIKLGYIGAEQAAAARADLEGLKGVTGDLSQSLPEGSAAWAKYKNILEDTSKGTEGLTGRSHELRLVSEQLNQILPGLGLAFRGMVTAMGPFAIVALSIQAAVTWWKYYHNSVNDAAEAHAVAMDKMRVATHDANQEIWNFNKIIKDQKTTLEMDASAFSLQNAILEAQITATKQLIEARKQLELSSAKTPEEKAAIEERYAGIESGSESSATNKRFVLLGQQINTIQQQMSSDLEKEAQITSQLQDASEYADVVKIKVFTKHLEENRKDYQDLQKHFDSLLEQQNRIQAVGGVQSEAAIEKRKIGIVSGQGGPERFLGDVAAAEAIREHGGKLSEGQVNTLHAFVDYAREQGAHNQQIRDMLYLVANDVKAQRDELQAMKTQLSNHGP